MRNEGEWRVCSNAKCGGKYHVDEHNIVDIPCECLTKSQANMRQFSKNLR